MPVLVNSMLKGEGRMNGAKLWPVACLGGRPLFVQVCSDPTAVQCNTVQGKMQCLQLRGALQDRLAAGLYHCNNTCEDLMFVQVCSDPTPVHCNTV